MGKTKVIFPRGGEKDMTFLPFLGNPNPAFGKNKGGKNKNFFFSWGFKFFSFEKLSKNKKTLKIFFFFFSKIGAAFF